MRALARTPDERDSKFHPARNDWIAPPIHFPFTAIEVKPA
jgi:hypothetical protein